ncbi:galactosyltransferase-related protein [Streptomyces decoyicus]|uniref:galactosyltransferase-related protein n=1 Tax=Streptomyces decoyicus TaxID=249567 RepID=UPI0033B30C23
MLPEVDVILADSGHQPFNRAASRNHGARLAGNRVAVICDADTIPEAQPLRDAIRHAASDGLLHLPYTRYRALSHTGTTAAIRGTRLAGCHAELELEGPQGGVLVMRADAWQAAGGMDERFTGWGFEDAAFHAAVRTVHGDVIRHQGVIHHLWHPSDIDFSTPAYAANRALCQRYEDAYGDPQAMCALQTECAATAKRTTA